MLSPASRPHSPYTHTHTRSHSYAHAYARLVTPSRPHRHTEMFALPSKRTGSDASRAHAHAHTHHAHVVSGRVRSVHCFELSFAPTTGRTHARIHLCVPYSPLDFPFSPPARRTNTTAIGSPPIGSTITRSVNANFLLKCFFFFKACSTPQKGLMTHFPTHEPFCVYSHE